MPEVTTEEVWRLHKRLQAKERRLRWLRALGISVWALVIVTAGNVAANYFVP